VKLRLACPSCEQTANLASPLPAEWQCPSCDHLLKLPHPAPEEPLRACAVCGDRELYRKKDFPHGLGLTILTVACVASFVTYALYEPWLTWAILIGSAAFDGLLYLLVGDVSVCYRCGAEYRGLADHKAHAPFELVVAERYRQERLRREGLKPTGGGRS
jgi:hypothetical protein